MPSRDGAGPPPAGGDDAAVSAPDVAVALMYVAHQQELAQLRRQIDELAELHRTHLVDHDRRPATVYTGPGVMAERIAHVRAATRRELRCLVGPGDWRPTDGPPHRIVAAGDDAAGTDPAVRWLPSVPLTMYLADDLLAVVARGRDGAVVVHRGLLVRVLGDLFEALWAQADPQQATRGAADQHEQLADLLLTGLTDQAIGHQLGVGQRTVQRRIAALLVDLGAVTRFQAGVQAALRAGTVPEPGPPGDPDRPTPGRGDRPGA